MSSDSPLSATGSSICVISAGDDFTAARARRTRSGRSRLAKDIEFFQLPEASPSPVRQAWKIEILDANNAIAVTLSGTASPNALKQAKASCKVRFR